MPGWSYLPFQVYANSIFNDTVGKAYVSDLSPAHLRATGQGAFKLATGGAAVVASIVAGVLWQAVAPGAVFALGAVAALLALGVLAVTPPRSPGRSPAQPR